MFLKLLLLKCFKQLLLFLKLLLLNFFKACSFRISFCCFCWSSRSSSIWNSWRSYWSIYAALLRFLKLHRLEFLILPLEFAIAAFVGDLETAPFGTPKAALVWVLDSFLEILDVGDLETGPVGFLKVIILMLLLELLKLLELGSSFWLTSAARSCWSYWN